MAFKNSIVKILLTVNRKTIHFLQRGEKLSNCMTILKISSLMQTITKHKRYNKLLPIHKEKNKLTKVLKKSQILDLINSIKTVS